MNKINKFLLVGMAAVLSLNALATPITQMTRAERIDHQIVQMKEDGVIPKNINISFNKVSEKQINEERLQAEALTDVSQETCNVKINVTENMKVGFSGTSINRKMFKDITEAKNQEQESLRTEYIVLHEASHCKLYEVKDVFKTGDSQVDNLLNQYYKFSGHNYSGGNGDASAYYILHENFADTHAFMHLLREHGPSNDLLKTIQQVQIERSEAASQNNPNGIIVHNTEFSLKELLKPENITKTMSLKSNQEVQEFALDIANKGMVQSLVNTDVARVVSLESLESGATNLFTSVMFKDTVGKTTESNISINWENNSLLYMANNAYKEFKANHDTSHIKTAQQYTDFVKANSGEIKDIVSKHVQNEMEQQFNKGNDIVSSINDHFYKTPQTPSLNIQQVKEQGIKDLETTAQLANTFKQVNSSIFAKENILNKINQISENSPLIKTTSANKLKI